MRIKNKIFLNPDTMPLPLLKGFLWWVPVIIVFLTTVCCVLIISRAGMSFRVAFCLYSVYFLPFLLLLGLIHSSVVDEVIKRAGRSAEGNVLKDDKKWKKVALDLMWTFLGLIIVFVGSKTVLEMEEWRDIRTLIYSIVMFIFGIKFIKKGLKKTGQKTENGSAKGKKGHRAKVSPVYRE